jgi:Protein of unknown function (DUF3467)
VSKSKTSSNPSLAVKDEEHKDTPLPTKNEQVMVDDSAVNANYANFCRLSGTPEEVIIDFGVNPQPMGQPERIEISQRVVTSWLTAKRLAQVLHLTISRHETAFGELEIDARKRVQHRP